jgi:hypothetical protein
MLGMIGFGMYGRKRSFGARQQETACVEYACARAARSDIHRDYKVRHAAPTKETLP